MGQKLALHGGQKAVADGLVKPWPPIDDLDRDLVLASINSATHSFGPNCAALQEEFAAWNGNRFAITTNSGTAALHMAVAACDCGAGDEVIVTSYSWSSSATCILQHNAIPVFVDIDFGTINIDVDQIEAAITPKTKAIIAVHLHGLPVNMDKVLEVARRHHLKVIEDCCQAHGGRFNGRKVGTFGDCAAFSCNQNKLLCSGEGGLFVTDDEEILSKAQALWSFGETRTPLQSRDYHAYALGWMYRNNDQTAAFARAQLKKLDGFLDQIAENTAAFAAALAGTPHLILPTYPDGHQANGYEYVIRIDAAALGHADAPVAFRDRVAGALAAEGVRAAIWQRFILPEMTVFQAKNAYGKGCPWECPHSQSVDYSPAKFPNARRHCDTHFGINLPLRPPNRPEAGLATAAGIRKVMENLDQLEA